MFAPSIPLSRFFIALVGVIGQLWILPDGTAQGGQYDWSDTLVAEKYIGESRRFNGDFDHQAALGKAQEAYTIYFSLYGDQHPKTAFSRMYVAREHRNLYREQVALELFLQSLPALEASRDTLRTALCHHGISLCLRMLFRHSEAHSHAQNAIDLLRADSVRRAGTLGSIYLNVGSIFNAQKKIAAAISVLEGVQVVFAQLNDPENSGMVGYHLGNSWFGLGDYTRAKEYFLSAYSNLKKNLKPGHPYFADLYVKIGLCCQNTGEPEVGLQYLLEAEQAYRRQGSESTDYVQFLQDLGQYYQNVHQPERAIEYLARCLEKREQRFGASDVHLLGILQVLGDACLQAGQYDRAENSFRRALQIAGHSIEENHTILYRLYGKLAETRYAQNDYAGCLLRCDTAFAAAGFYPESPQEVFPRDYFRELCLLYSRAQFRLWQQNSNTVHLFRAEQYAAFAAETLYREVEEITVNSSREIFYDRDHTVLEHWLDTRMSLYAATGEIGHAEAAFQIAAKSKAFLLAEAMRQNGAIRYAGVPDSILQIEISLRESIVAAEKQIETASASTDFDKNLLFLNNELAHWRRDYDALLRRIERHYPEYFRLRKLSRGVSMDELRAKALSTDQALLLYSLTSTSCYTFLLTQDTFLVHTAPFDTELDEAVLLFHQSLTGYYSAPNPTDALYDQHLETSIATAQVLYQKLVHPVAAQLPRRLIIMPDGKLWRLPFEALLTEAPSDAGNFRTYPFWVREKAISYCLSPDLLLETAAQPRRKAEKYWLGLAPFFGNRTGSDLASRGDAVAGFPPLQHSGWEVNTIATLLQGETWTGEAVRPGRFIANAHRYAILHLATHSRADNRLGHYSFVVTSPTGETLPAKDLFALSLAADMVVLSACEAGGGKLLRGEGIIGLVRGFAYAGARSVVASQWVVNDQSTARLLVDFYQNLQKGLPKDQALQAAQTGFLSQYPAQAHPFFWAGFRVYGNTGAIKR